ncbi:MAG TPA: hypothetical protein VLH56_19525 [Dissulfurispiraceae bacterium]|nr:hypothetical protein [Dissulfurispiraceae bacterium]
MTRVTKYEQDRDWLIEQLKLGAAYTEIAKRYAITGEAVRCIVKRMGLKCYHQGGTNSKLRRQALQLTKYHYHYRECPKCHELKAPEEYSWYDKDHTRRHSYCKRCVADKVNALRNTPEGLRREREWQAANSDKCREYLRKWYQAHREEYLRKCASYYAKNRETILAKMREAYHRRKAAKEKP